MRRKPDQIFNPFLKSSFFCAGSHPDKLLSKNRRSNTQHHSRVSGKHWLASAQEQARNKMKVKDAVSAKMPEQENVAEVMDEPETKEVLVEFA
jgi:hypothetical protein